MNFLTSVPVIIWISRSPSDNNKNNEIFFDILNFSFLVFENAKIENSINKRTIAISIWTVIVFAVRLLSTTVLPNQAWKRIAIKAKNDNAEINFLVLINFKETKNNINTDNPARAPISLFIYSIQVWYTLNFE